VLRAAQVVSGEAEQGRLLGSFMRILLESAGAQKGFLLLEREGQLLVEAEGTVEGETRVLQGTVTSAGPDLPVAIIDCSAHGSETLILSDCSRDERFADDPYVQARKPLSVLCMPVLHRGRPMGQLYLENNRVRDAFTPEDVELIGILASQAAISFTNVRLYEEMRQEVAERKQVEQALKRAHDQLETRIDERTGQISRANERLAGEIREREAMQVKLEEAKEAAETANRAKSEFLASMSHELRTPLNAILGYAQILRRRRDLDEAARGGVAIIERSGEHLLTLINDILSLSRIEAGKLETLESDFDLTVLLENICDMARVRARAKGLAFRYQAQTPLPALVRGDERWLRQILLNLLSNGAKFTDRGGLTLRAAADPPASGVVHLCFEVEDTGIGIPAEQQERIFEPFEQVHSLARSQEGLLHGLLCVAGKHEGDDAPVAVVVAAKFAQVEILAGNQLLQRGAGAIGRFKRGEPQLAAVGQRKRAAIAYHRGARRSDVGQRAGLLRVRGGCCQRERQRQYESREPARCHLTTLYHAAKCGNSPALTSTAPKPVRHPG